MRVFELCMPQELDVTANEAVADAVGKRSHYERSLCYDVLPGTIVRHLDFIIDFNVILLQRA